MKQPKTYTKVERKSWNIAKQWVYHTDCWRLKKEAQAFINYRNRLI